MFRARRMMELDVMLDRVRSDQTAALNAQLAEAEAIQAAAALRDADNEATTVLDIAIVLARLELDRLDLDRTGVQILGADGSQRSVVLICPGDADDEISEIIPGPWGADEEATCVYNQADIEALLGRR